MESAYMSTRHVKPLSSWKLPFLLFDPPAGFPSSRPQDVAAGARRVCQGWPLFSGPPTGSAFTRPSTMAGLMGRVDYTPASYLSVYVSASGIPITDVDFGRPCYEVHGACDNRINLYPAAPIRLAKVLLAWTIAQAGWG